MSKINLKFRILIENEIIFIKYLLPVQPNWSQNEKRSEVIEIWHTRYFKYGNMDFDAKNGFYEIFTSCKAKLTPKLKLL